MKFRHSHVVHGSVSHEDQTYPIVDGIIDCPESLAHAHGWLAVPDAPPPSIDQLIEDTLKGTVAEVQAALAEVPTVEVLEAVKAAEAKGRNRKGVLDAVAARQAELTKPAE